MMLLMESKVLRNICALVARDLADAVRNPMVLMACVAGALLSSFIGAIVGTSSRLGAGEADSFAMAAVLGIVPAFAGCVVELYVMAEERERGVYLTLVEAGVPAGQIAVAKWLSAIVVTLLTEVVACLLLGLEPGVMAGLLVLSLVTLQPVLLAGLACGLCARDQMSSNLLAVPLTAVSVAPMLSFMSGTIRGATWFWPQGPAAEMVRLANGLDPAVSLQMLVVLAALWIVAGVALALWASRRFSCGLAAERDRRDGMH